MTNRKEQNVCRVCGGTLSSNNPNNYYWLEDDLCSKCIDHSTAKEVKGFRKAFRGRFILETSKKLKPVLRIIEDSSNIGWDADFSEYIRGDNWFWIIDKCTKTFQAAINSINGDFILYLPESDISFDSNRMDFIKDGLWNETVINLLYTNKNY
ncbi:hypothetical protein NE686_18080 [Tissierella carlieri]|uniref:Uncharacterized protein n=1 Tax=Tissierella carlieri TaxID=689904 RepID=A0ABT1SEX0_9FIRM|nr:hypothetical protein [Tissierella carlieri]MCQ4925015.1 hypothetical protein [Tissierella carlieri]